MQAVEIHTQVTRKSQYRYAFHPKHHGGDLNAGTWVVDHGQEFSVFDLADFNGILDEPDRLYGVLPAADGSLIILGKWHEGAPDNRRGDKFKPSKEIFKKMEQAGLISNVQRKRLAKGDFAT